MRIIQHSYSGGWRHDSTMARRLAGVPVAFGSTLLAGVLILAGVPFAKAQDDTSGVKPDTSAAQGAPAATPSIQSSLGVYGDPGGLRAFLDAKGIGFNFTYIGDGFGNPTGGVKQGATFEGRLDGNLDIDLEKLAGLKGAALHAEAFQIHGRGLSGNNTLDQFTTSFIEAYPSTKLYEVWYEQKLADDKLFVRLGQVAADTEFFVSQTATLFINSSYGFPAILANNLPSGGNAYPLGALGGRVKYVVNDNITALAELVDGDPAGPFVPGVNAFLPQVRDYSGTLFRTQDAPLLYTEGQFTYNQEKDAKGLPGTVKIGYIHHFGTFASNDAPIGATGNLRGDDFAYAIIDQTIYRKPGTDDQGASVFLRAAGAPSDRNLVDLYVDGGVSYKGLLPGRPNDTVGVSGAYFRISPDVALQDQLAGAAPLVRDYSGLIEATYQYVVVPGFSLQPDFQYLVHPGAHGVAIPGTNQPIRNAAVFGLRATVHY